MLCYALHGRLSAELQATNNVFQSCYKMDFWPAGAIMAEDQVDGWLAGETKVGAATAQDQQLCDQNGSAVWRCACTAATDAFAAGALVTLLVTKEMSTGGCDLGWSARLVMEARQRK